MARNRRIGSLSSMRTRVAFLAGLGAYAFALQFTTANLGSIDGYFHIRYAAILRAAGLSGFPPSFTALPLTILAPDRYFDHHFLFHVWLALFAGDHPILGAKLAAAIGATAAFAACYLFLLRIRVRNAEWWTVALVSAAPGFAYRIEMPRVQAWSLVCLVAALCLLIRRRFVWLFPLAWFYTWMYDGFPYFLFFAVCAMAAGALLRREADWRPLGWAAAGVAAGLVINPYFPHDLGFIALHYLGKIGSTPAIPVGAEWNPPLIAHWFGSAGLVALLAGLALLLYQQRTHLDETRLTLALAAAGLLVLQWHASRFVELFIPVAGFALASTLHVPIDEFLRHRNRRWRRVLAAVLTAALTATTLVAAHQLRGRPPATRYAGVGLWLTTHAPRGAMIFNTAWDDFPFLYYHHPAGQYVIGLDPTYLARRNLDLYHSWSRISSGDVAHPVVTMRRDFGASFAVTNHGHAAFIAALDADPHSPRVYEDDDGIVYSLGGTPPTAAARDLGPVRAARPGRR